MPGGEHRLASATSALTTTLAVLGELEATENLAGVALGKVRVAGKAFGAGAEQLGTGRRRSPRGGSTWQA